MHSLFEKQAGFASQIFELKIRGEGRSLSLLREMRRNHPIRVEQDSKFTSRRERLSFMFAFLSKLRTKAVIEVREMNERLVGVSRETPSLPVDFMASHNG